MAEGTTAPETPACRVLVADDDLTSRTILLQLLRKWGYETVSAADGDEAWSLLQAEGAPSLLLLDWMMPGKDGETLCRMVRQRSETRYIILITSKDRTEDIVKGLEAGADEYIVKPFDKDELRARIRAGERILGLELALRRRVAELETALAEIETLRGMLPICSYCKRVRNDGNYWQDIESYIAAHSETTFSHGVCPECYAKIVQPELDALKAEKKIRGGAGNAC